MKNQPILVIGCVRSGTTWVGRIIAESGVVGYLHEPFNRWESREHPGAYGTPVPWWYLYVCKENESAYREPMQKMLRFRYSLSGGLRRSGPAHAERLIREHRLFRAYRLSNSRPLVKDPFALFSAEWFAETFDAAVVVMIRHPAAIASSIMWLGWEAPFHDFLAQPLLMRGPLHPFEAQLRQWERAGGDAIEESALLWNTIHGVVDAYREKHKDWIFLRHEDVSRDPLLHFRRLFERLGLELTPAVERAIRERSSAANPSDVGLEAAYSLWRDSASAIWNWKKRLTMTEIERIREGTRELAPKFYSEVDW